MAPNQPPEKVAAILMTQVIGLPEDLYWDALRKLSTLNAPAANIKDLIENHLLRAINNDLPETMNQWIERRLMDTIQGPITKYQNIFINVAKRYNMQHHLSSQFLHDEQTDLTTSLLDLSQRDVSQPFAFGYVENPAVVQIPGSLNNVAVSEMVFANQCQNLLGTALPSVSQTDTVQRFTSLFKRNTSANHTRTIDMKAFIDEVKRTGTVLGADGKRYAVEIAGGQYFGLVKNLDGTFMQVEEGQQLSKPYFFSYEELMDMAEKGKQVRRHIYSVDKTE
jgi:hypothetical protein